MPTVNEILQQRAIRHAVFLEGLKRGEVDRMLQFLNGEVYPDLTFKIESRLRRITIQGFDTGLFTTRRLADLSRTINETTRAGIHAAGSRLQDTLSGLAIDEGEFQRALLRNSFKDAAGISIDTRLPNLQLLRSTVTNYPMRGKIISKHFDELGRSAATRINEQISIGLTQGEGIDKIMRRIRGTVALRFSNGTTAQVNRAASTLVRTSVNHVATQAREITYQENSDIVKSVRYVATLDARTTDICASLDGKEFPIGEGERPPMHHQCRSTTVPITKSWKELDIPLKEATAGQRAALNGRVPEKQTFDRWLRGQPRGIQDEVLGKGRAEIFRGGTPIQRFVDTRNKPRTLTDMRRLEGTGEFAPPPTDPVKLQEEIDDLLEKLRNSTDSAEQKKLRAMLRRRGHKGGTGNKKVTPKPIPPSLPESKSVPAPPPPPPPPELRGKGVLRSGREIREEMEVVRIGQRERIEKLKVEREEELGRRNTDALEWNRLIQKRAKEEGTNPWDDAIVSRMKKDHKDLFDRISKAHDRMIELDHLIEQANNQVTKELHEVMFIRNEPTLDLKFNLDGAAARSKNIKTITTEAEEWLRKMVSSRAMPVDRMNIKVLKIEQKRLLAFHSSGTVHLRPIDDIGTVIHEAGHAFEFRNSVWLRRTQAFLRERARGETLERLQVVMGDSRYGASEMTWKDKFFHPYVGKFYDDATEITSMALEVMFNNPGMILDKDPEMLELILNLIRGL